jgi:hypothetical protein
MPTEMAPNQKRAAGPTGAQNPSHTIIFDVIWVAQIAGLSQALAVLRLSQVSEHEDTCAAAVR